MDQPHLARLERSGPAHPRMAYSSNLVEGLFCELGLSRVLRTSPRRRSTKLVLREYLLTRKGPREYVLYAYAVRQTKCVLYEYAYRQTRTRKDCSNMVPGRDKRQEPG